MSSVSMGSGWAQPAGSAALAQPLAAPADTQVQCRLGSCSEAPGQGWEAESWSRSVHMINFPAAV